MNCAETRSKLVDYLGNELSPSEKKLIQAHLAACEACQQELAEISALQSRMGQYFQARAAQAVPSERALDQLQAGLAREAQARPSSRQAGWLSSKLQAYQKGAKTLMKQPIFVTLIVLALLVATSLSVPAVRGQMENTFAGWSGFSIPNSPDYMAIKSNWGFTPLNPTRMPKDLKLKSSMVAGGNTTTSLALLYLPDHPTQGEPVQLPSDRTLTPEENSQSLWKPGDPFVEIVQTVITGTQTLPAGTPVKIRQTQGVLETLGAGAIEWCRNCVTYPEAQRLTWFENGVQFQITGSYASRELLKVANSMVLVDVSLGEKPPTAPSQP